MAAVTGGVGGGAGNGEAPVGELSYTEASRELDAIVAYFEQRDVDVDQLVARLERATALVSELDRRLRRTRVQVEQLVPKLAAVLAGGVAEDGDGEDGDAEVVETIEVVEVVQAVEVDEPVADEAVADDPPPRRPGADGDDHPGLF